MKKNLLFLSTLAFTCSQMSALTTFTGVKAKNDSGKAMEVMIDNGINGWMPVDNSDSANLKSKKTNGRFIYWREPSKPQTQYQTLKGYNSPDTITIKDGGKKYDMSSGIGGLDKDSNKTAKIIVSEKTKEYIKKEIDTLNKNIESLDKMVSEAQSDYNKLSKSEQQKTLSDLNETKTIVASTKAKLMKEIANKQTELINAKK